MNTIYTPEQREKTLLNHVDASRVDIGLRHMMDRHVAIDLVPRPITVNTCQCTSRLFLLVLVLSFVVIFSILLFGFCGLTSFRSVVALPWERLGLLEGTCVGYDYA